MVTVPTPHQHAAGERTATPLVTILVPAFNAAKFLRAALESIVRQTYPALEILVLDDGSTDETGVIAREFAPRVTYVRQPRNLGQFDNVNDGIERAHGAFVAVYHADDIYEPTIVEAQVAYFLAHPQVVAVFASDIFIDADGREYGRLTLPPEIRGERALDQATVLNALLTYKNRFLVGPTAMVRTDVQRAVGRYRREEFPTTADLDMWLRLAAAGPLAVLEQHLMRYRHFHDNATHKYFHMRTAPEHYFVIMDRQLDAGLRPLATAHALVNYEAHRAEDRIMSAISHYIRGEPDEGRRALHEARLAPVLRATQVQKWRLLGIVAGLSVLLRLPRSEWIAQRMYRRWHVKRAPKPSRRAPGS